MTVDEKMLASRSGQRLCLTSAMSSAMVLLVQLCASECGFEFCQVSRSRICAAYFSKEGRSSACWFSKSTSCICQNFPWAFAASAASAARRAFG